MDEILRIIIADDNKILAEMMKKIIEENQRYKVIAITSDEEEQINLINILKPHLVITDLKRKNKWTGLDIIEKCNNSIYKPIFFIISASATYYIEEIRKLKISYYLNKPYQVEDLMRILNDIYDSVYPKAIVEVKNNISKKEDKSFWNNLIKKIKRIGK